MLRDILMYAVLPLWVAAGLADWWLHKRSRIEATTGVRESIFHLTLFLQMGLAGVAVLFLEVNAALLTLLLGLFLLHEATTWLELRWVMGQRPISATEQMVHSFLEMLPLFALLALVALHASTGAHWSSNEAWTLAWKSEPLPWTYVVGMVALVATLNLLPLLEELRRCLRAAGAGRKRAVPPARGRRI